jgi:5'-3' exonuclease, N-terminal resolvase-like domain/T4 RNase H, C terminal
MLIIDLNQVLISNLMQQLNSHASMKLDENLIRHMVLNSLRSYVKQFRQKYGEVVIACDSRKYWRKDVFPFYKANRKKDRDASVHDWTLIFESLNKIRDELAAFSPYKVINVEGAEADDIIAVLVARKSANEDVLILSSDKDFMQLQKYPNVTQYSPILKRYIKTDDPHSYIKEHILRGDRGDGIPNFLSSDNTFATGERQKVINSKKLAVWLTQTPEEICVNDTMLRGFKRNQMLVDMDYIPEAIKSLIVDAYENVQVGNKQKLMNYFIEKRLTNLLEGLQDF